MSLSLGLMILIKKPVVSLILLRIDALQKPRTCGALLSGTMVKARPKSGPI